MNAPDPQDVEDDSNGNRVTCPECKGKGWLRDFDPPGTYTCPICDGLGQIEPEEIP